MARVFERELYDPVQQGVVDMPSLRAAMQQLTEIEPAKQLLVYNQQLLLEAMDEGDDPVTVQPVTDGVVSTISVYERPPLDMEVSVKIHMEGVPDMCLTFSAGTHVHELHRLVARRHLLAPYRQEFTTLQVTMNDWYKLADYAASDPLDIWVRVLEERVAHPVVATVRRRNSLGSVPFMMRSRDTLDMLLGKMERAGMVVQGEELTLISSTGHKMLENWKSFREHRLTHVQLRILEYPDVPRKSFLKEEH